ncbi:hypothetical protein ABZ016_24535 [Streptomyces sp. NPDC006372]|uniref:hypothetical protein n=1 Tax=Streptomyces sp. NPDC006372 TaxID=3155599 RepID=UPI0033BB32DB
MPVSTLVRVLDEVLGGDPHVGRLYLVTGGADGDGRPGAAGAAGRRRGADALFRDAGAVVHAVCGPSDYPPWRTIYGFARRWAVTGVLGLIRDQLRRRIRLAAGKTPQTASVIVDSQ